MKKLKSKKDAEKRGISVMVGYVLLISFGIIMSVLVYSYLKTYVPKEPLACPDSASLFIKSANCESNSLSLIIRNNGKFNIAGYYIYGSSNEEGVATDPISKFVIENTYGTGPQFINGYVDFSLSSGKENSFLPTNEVNHTFELEQEIRKIEIIPLRHQKEGNSERLASCTEAKISEIIICG